MWCKLLVLQLVALASVYSEETTTVTTLLEGRVDSTEGYPAIFSEGDNFGNFLIFYSLNCLRRRTCSPIIFISKNILCCLFTFLMKS